MVQWVEDHRRTRTPIGFDQAWDWLSYCKFYCTWPQKIIHHKSPPHFNFDNQYTSQCVGKRVLSLGTWCMRTKGWIGLSCLGMLGSLPGSHTSSLASHPSLNSRLLYKLLVSMSPPTLSMTLTYVEVVGVYLSRMLYKRICWISPCIVQQCILTLRFASTEEIISLLLEVSPPGWSMHRRHSHYPYSFQYLLKVK